jgi:tetratricopeptide (TPR) repeat protein
MAEIRAGILAHTVRVLSLAGQWARAEELLNAVTSANDGERAVLAVAKAEVNVDQDFWCRTKGGPAALARADAAVANVTDAGASSAGVAGAPATLRYDLDFQILRHGYFTELIGPDGPRFGPDGRDTRVIDSLASRVRRLRADAPDVGRRAAATFYAGLIEDNLRGDPAAGEALFAEALSAAEQAGDVLTESEALRHLGYMASESGDTDQARRQWERSLELRQRAGAVPYVLAQFLLLAGLARDAGEEAGARAVAREAGRWAHALGSGLLESQAASIARD